MSVGQIRRLLLHKEPHVMTELPAQPHHIYYKTAAGVAALATRNTPLTPRMRQLLVLLDGRRGHDELARLIEGPALAAMLDTLLDAGLISDRAPPASAPAAPPGAPAALPREQLEAVRALMKDSARRHLGLLAHAVHDTIERVQCAHTLQVAVARWHMALRDSQSGQAEADLLLGSLRELLEAA
jgi:hypothetical protein